MKNILLLLIFCCLWSFLLACNSEPSQLSEKNRGLSRALQDTTQQDTTAPSNSSRTIKIIGVGDLMIGTNYPSKSSLPANDGKDLLSHVSSYLRDADLTFGNLEGVLLEKGGNAKSCNNPRYCYTFRMPERYAKHLVHAGFDVLATANNHANDFGKGGRENTAKVLEKAGLHFAGSLEKPYTTFEKDGIRYGFLAAAPNSGCFNMKEYNQAAQYVAMLDSICDIVLVSFHAGAEGTNHRHTPCRDEVFLGFNRGDVCKFAKKCIDAGADVLFGHGPHVTRAVELYKDRFIIYSMGNFCTYDKFSLNGAKGVGPIVKLHVNEEGVFLKGQIIPTKQHGRGIPKYDSTHRVTKEIIELSKTDFPDSPLEILENGTINRMLPLPQPPKSKPKPKQLIEIETKKATKISVD